MEHITNVLFPSFQPLGMFFFPKLFLCHGQIPAIANSWTKLMMARRQDSKTNTTKSSL